MATARSGSGRVGTLREHGCQCAPSGGGGEGVQGDASQMPASINTITSAPRYLCHTVQAPGTRTAAVRGCWRDRLEASDS